MAESGNYPGDQYPTVPVGPPSSVPPFSGPSSSVPPSSVPPAGTAYGAGYPTTPYPPATGYPAGPLQPQYDAYGRPLSDKSKVVAGVLGIALGGFGAGRFYTGHTGIGVAQLVVTLLTCGLGHFWGLIDGIMILVNGGTDAQGRILRD